jgi:porphobilinogen synthase
VLRGPVCPGPSVFFATPSKLPGLFEDLADLADRQTLHTLKSLKTLETHVSSSFPGARPRRLRTTPAMRRMVAETRLHPSDLILPAFVREGISAPVPISAMPGVVQHTRETLRKAAVEAVSAGVSGIMLFGVPEDAKKDATGTAGTDPDGILQQAIRDVRAEVGDELIIMSDLCLDEYTDHGHCGVLTADGRVDNDATLERYAEMAQVQADAGAHVVGPSGMMDGQVGVIRDALDQIGKEDVSVLAYTVKYSSAFFGPFREAVGSSLVGDRKTYQQDPANVRESLRELALDLAEGADMVMVKPAGPYLDILARIADASEVPVAAYQISGEYAMVEAAAERGWIDRDQAIMETLTGIKRAGADMILTYWATEVAQQF